MATTTSGLAFSPQALDPYPIETELAKTAYNQPEQQTLMDQYWFERMANKNLYGQEIGLNRELQQQQMVNALREKALGQLKEGGTIPGVASVIAPYLGLTPEQQATLSGAATTAAGAENLSKSAGGINSLSQAGFGLPIPQAQQITGVTGLVAQDPRDIAVAKIRAAATLAAAAMHANAAAMPGESVASPPDPALGGATHNYSFPGKLGLTDQQKRDYLLRTGNFGSGATAGTNLPPSQRGAASSLPQAKTDTPANNAPAAAAPPGKTVIEANKARIPGPVYQDIVAGGYKTVQGPDSKTRFQGASGKLY